MILNFNFIVVDIFFQVSEAVLVGFRAILDDLIKEFGHLNLRDTKLNTKLKTDVTNMEPSSTSTSTKTTTFSTSTTSTTKFTSPAWIPIQSATKSPQITSTKVNPVKMTPKPKTTNRFSSITKLALGSKIEVFSENNWNEPLPFVPPVFKLIKPEIRSLNDSFIHEERAKNLENPPFNFDVDNKLEKSKVEIASGSLDLQPLRNLQKSEGMINGVMKICQILIRQISVSPNSLFVKLTICQNIDLMNYQFVE